MMETPVASLLDPPASSVLLADVAWIQGTLLGTLATVLAVIAVAAIGFAMFTGRIDLRKGLTVVVGCFILFGAPAIAAGLLELTDREAAVDTRASGPPVPLAVVPPPLPTAPKNQLFDPYAGAAVPQ